jgi:hypothetical protein
MPLRKCARAHPAIQRASVMVDDSHDIGRSEEGVISSQRITGTANACDEHCIVSRQCHGVLGRYFNWEHQLTRCIRGRSLCPSLATRLRLASAHEELGSNQPLRWKCPSVSQRDAPKLASEDCVSVEFAQKHPNRFSYRFLQRADPRATTAAREWRQTSEVSLVSTESNAAILAACRASEV